MILPRHHYKPIAFHAAGKLASSSAFAILHTDRWMNPTVAVLGGSSMASDLLTPPWTRTSLHQEKYWDHWRDALAKRLQMVV
ncbi:hypothetical protein NUW54_g12883 [Trametes sanguinea]|nr:hypothetical protein NUW54_g12883 [Trametes sanguinea]